MQAMAAAANAALSLPGLIVEDLPGEPSPVVAWLEDELDGLDPFLSSLPSRKSRSLFLTLAFITLPAKAFQTYSSEGPSSRTFICRPLLAGASTNQLHGQRFKATTVRVVSNELAKVRVDVYHCHGLKAVSASYVVNDQ